MSRPSWDEYFGGVAEVVATRATCDRAYVGAVLVRDRRILSTGYNGSPPGEPHCDDVGHTMSNGHCIATSHAELNAIAQAARAGARLEGATCYVTHAPCPGCRKALASAGIIRVVYRQTRGEPPPEQWAGITFERMP